MQYNKILLDFLKPFNCIKKKSYLGKLICILFFLILFIFWLCWVFVAARGLSLVAASGGYSSLQCTCFSLQWLLTCGARALECAGFSSCSAWAQQLWRAGSRAHGLQQLWHTGIVAPRNVGSSRTRDRIRVPCIGRRILNHCVTREVLICILIHNQK